MTKQEIIRNVIDAYDGSKPMERWLVVERVETALSEYEKELKEKQLSQYDEYLSNCIQNSLVPETGIIRQIFKLTTIE